MIDFIKGVVRLTEQETISVLPEGLGIGYVVSVSDPHRFQLGQQIELHCYQHYNQEHGSQLFGFADNAQKKLFLLVLNCSGIGPKMALSLAGNLNAAQLLAAIEGHDTRTICSVPGIGPKKGEQLLLYLKHKTDELLALAPTRAANESISAISQVGQALATLGYSQREISAVTAHLYTKYNDANASFDELMRAAFATLPMLQMR